MRTPYIASNWKMHKTREEARNFLKSFKEMVSDISNVEIGIGPTYTSLDVVSNSLEGTAIKTVAQNMYHEPEGAYTGEIAPGMLTEIDCDHVIIGHSERRNIFKEDDELINKKLKAVYENGMTPILCIGESQVQRNRGETKDVLRNQLKMDLEGLDHNQVSKLVIAYEPIWAIGTGESASPEDAQEGCSFVRDEIKKTFDKETATNVRIQYGGSIKPHNAKKLMSQPDIDGGLVGSASLKPQSFSEIIHITEDLT